MNYYVLHIYLISYFIIRLSFGFAEAWQPAVDTTLQYVTLTFPDIYVVRAIVMKGK